VIAILCPTRGRPEQLNNMVESVSLTVDNPVYIAIAPSKASDIDIRNISQKTIISIFDCPENLPTAHKWNMLAENAMKSGVKLLMLGADDMVFETPHWDKALIDHYNALENKIHVYSLQDSRDENGTPHIICTREYIEAMGYFLPPIFLHWFVDSWTVEIARSNNCFTHFKEFILRHDKPSDIGKPDETHSRIRQWGWLDRDRWVAAKMGHVLEAEKKRLACAFG